jgi:hypothetical protein
MMTRSPTTLRLPAVAHIHATPRQQQVGSHSEMLIADKDDAAAVQDVRQVQRLRFQAGGGVCGQDLTVGSEAGDAAVGVHGQLEMRDGLRGVVEQEEVAARGA